MKLIINSDDFGYSQGHNYGIIRAFTHGVLTSTTLMANGKEVNHAIELIRLNPTLDVGIHVVLDHGAPLSPTHLIPSLVNEHQTFNKSNLELAHNLNLDEVTLEIETQIQSLLDQGVELTHIDSHHHIHMQPHLFPTFVALAKKYQFSLRLVQGVEASYEELLKKEKVKYVHCNHRFYKETVSLDYFEPYEFSEEVEELMTHPAYCDEIILNESSYAMHRVLELDVLCNTSLPTLLKEQNIELISFKHIKEKI
jgi:chitin disaccharide deacetylase